MNFSSTQLVCFCRAQAVCAVFWHAHTMVSTLLLILYDEGIKVLLFIRHLSSR